MPQFTLLRRRRDGERDGIRAGGGGLWRRGRRRGVGDDGAVRREDGAGRNQKYLHLRGAQVDERGILTLLGWDSTKS